MARAGLYKSDVKKARDSLIAQSLYPSVDAVRVALGNTGSKTTIHKYLKELDEEEGDGTRKSTVSDALLDLVERLAARLEEEADARVAGIAAGYADRENSLAAVEAQLKLELGAAKDHAKQLEAAVQAEAAAHAATRLVQQNEAIARHTAEQQVSDLKERLAENEAHRASLEDKHEHARLALEHYRQAAKEQREQEQRRHEHQIQQLQAELRQAHQVAAAKQEDVTKLNQEGVKLVADLSHAKQALYEAQRLAREHEAKLEKIPALEQKLQGAQEKSADSDARIEHLTNQLQAADSHAKELAGKVRELELALASARATADGQLGLAAELRRLLDSHGNADQAKERGEGATSASKAGQGS
ncbi:DNA-binding protein [Duganella vulcania]|uniref:Integrase n=1 Tax=Duganella vulcania TaxID=2692166 RepID=A0A845GGF9_9BURK|nr:DNA-binding protein [Duganella vulcania]MYM92326.1 integrase [Duganella vulcania]